MSICPHPCPSGPTGAPGRRFGAGPGLSPLIPVRSKRLELGFGEGALHSCSDSSAVESGGGQRENVGS